MAHKEKSELKRRAMLAKQRLKMGYWNSIDGNRRMSAGTVGAPYVGARLIRDEATESSKAEERLYKRVCEILDKDDTAINPIGQLIENDVYDKLEPSAKQRYILELSSKFRELKERYYREKTGA